jgi:hypothetical protein
MAAPEGVQQKTIAELMSESDEKKTQARLAQANGDKPTARRLWKEISELNLQISHNQRWPYEPSEQGESLAANGSREGRRSPPTDQLQEPQDKETLKRVKVLLIELNALGAQLLNHQRRTEEAYSAMEEQLAHYYARALAIVAMLTKEVVDETDDQDRATSTSGSRSRSEDSNITDDLESDDTTAFEKDIDRRDLEVDYGCLTSDPNPFEELADYARHTPWWLGAEGYEDLTAQWFELDEEGREKIAAIERDIVEERDPHTTQCNTKPTTTTHDSCSCGNKCWLPEALERREQMYPKDGLTREKQNSEYAAVVYNNEFQRITGKAQNILKNLEEDNSSRGKHITRREEQCLKEILAVAKGKRRAEEPRERERRLRTDEPFDRRIISLRNYCTWVDSRQHFEVDAEVLKLTKRLLAVAEREKNEQQACSY